MTDLQKKISMVVTVAIAIIPQISFAATTLDNLLLKATSLIEIYIIPLAFACAFLFFIYGVARYMFAGADDTKAYGRQLMVWGVIALFVLSSIWGIVQVLNVTFGFESGSAGGAYRHTCIPVLGSGGANCNDTI